VSQFVKTTIAREIELLNAAKAQEIVCDAEHLMLGGQRLSRSETVFVRMRTNCLGGEMIIGLNRLGYLTLDGLNGLRPDSRDY
jgi:hypothetical protein